jgi:PAS domain S-box-containing protein
MGDSAWSSRIRAMVVWGRVAAALVIASSVLDWVGWAAGIPVLTRLHPAWPHMVPWTALLLAGLAFVVLLRSGDASPGRIRAGQGVALAVGAGSAVLLAQYLTGRSFGVDVLWFRESVMASGATWPGRPSVQTLVAMALMAGALGLTRLDRRGVRVIWAACLAGAVGIAGIAAVSYVFQATALVETSKTNGMALRTALALVAIGLGAMSLPPVAGALARPDRWAMVRLGLLVAAFPVAVGLALRAVVALGFGGRVDLLAATLLATLIVGAFVLFLGSREQRLRTEVQRQAERIAHSEQNFRLLTGNIGDVVGHVRDGQVVWVSPSVEAAMGAPAEQWVGQNLVDLASAEDAPVVAAMLADAAEGGAVERRVRGLSVDGVAHWFDLSVAPFDAENGHRDGVAVAARLVDDTVAAEQALAAAQRQQVRSEARCRRMMDNAAIGMCLVTPDGRFAEVNDALCRFFGYDAETLTRKTWQELTAKEFLDVDLQKVQDVLCGRRDSYRMVKQYIHADGHRVWGDLSVSCIRDDNGQVEHFVSQITDITRQVEALDRLERQSQQMASELRSAADYMASIMPSGLMGKVAVSSRYLPSRQLGGDCFDYTWVDDDHLLVYLLDVSGHGIEPALLSVSVHNALRSGLMTQGFDYTPETILAELNQRFQMDRHGEHYFTIWLGVYQASTRTLRYASAGAPPAFAFTAATGQPVTATELSTDGPPVGMFADAVFVPRSFAVPPGCQLLIFSDGAYELELDTTGQLTLEDFRTITTRLAAAPDWSLDDLLEELRPLVPAQAGFDDDCSLIHMTFD